MDFSSASVLLRSLTCSCFIYPVSFFLWLGGRIQNIHASRFSLLGLLVGDSSTSTVTLYGQLEVGVVISGLVSWVDWALRLEQ